jgi:hypothetical protein
MTKFKYLLLCILLLTLAQQAGADYKFDGTPIVSVTHGSVAGGIYVDGGHGVEDTMPYTQSFNIPGNVIYARLYVGVWGGTPDYTGTVETVVNEHTLGTLNLAGKADTNPNVVCTGFGVYLVTYEVTPSYLREGANIVTVTTAGDIDGRVYGITLAAIYENEGAPEVEYWLNDGHENLNVKTPHDSCTTSFDAATSTDTNASLTVAYLCGGPGEKDYLYMNGNQIGGDDVADSMGDSAYSFDLKTFDVSPHFDPSGNTILFKRGDETAIHPFLAVLALEGGTTTEPPQEDTEPDLVIDRIDAPDRVFAEKDNTIEVTVKNQADYDVKYAFDVELFADSISLGTVRVPDLGAGESETLQFVWNPDDTIRYTLRANADSNHVIDESDEENNDNVLVVDVGVEMGYYGDDSIETFKHDTINGSIVYTLGNSSYADQDKLKKLSSDDECGYVVGCNLTLPLNATVGNARLYVYWTWGTDGSEGREAEMNVTFGNNADISADKKYTDRKGYDPYNYPSGTYCYNVTDYIEDGNGSMVNYTTIVRNTGEGYAKFAIYGVNLLVVYEDLKEPEIEYWINEGCDIIHSFDDDEITPEDATTRISFSGVIDLAEVRKGTLITFVTDGTTGGDELGFNTETWDDVYEGDTGDITIDERDVTDHLNTSGNYAQIREINEQGMVPSTAILILERGQKVPNLGAVPVAVGEITDMGIHYISDDTYGAVFGTLRFAIYDRFDRIAGYREAEDIWVYAVPASCEPDYNLWTNVTATSKPTRTLRIFDDPYTNETQDYETEICFFDEDYDGFFDEDNETSIYRTTTSYDGTFALRLDGGMYDIYARY